MDFLVLKNPGEGVETNLKAALDKVGPTIMFRPFESEDLETELKGMALEFPNQPVNLVVDLSNAELKNWDKPIRSMLNSRLVTGQSLPEGSSIILLAGIADEEVASNLSDATRARLVTVDFKSTKAELGLDKVHLSTLMAPDVLAQLTSKMAQANLAKIQGMVSAIAPVGQHVVQATNSVIRDYVVLKAPGAGIGVELETALNQVGCPNLSFRPKASDNLGKEVHIADHMFGHDPLGQALELEMKIVGYRPITTFLDVSGHENEKEWVPALQSVLDSRMIGGEELPHNSSMVIQMGMSAAEFNELPEAFKSRLEVIDLQSLAVESTHSYQEELTGKATWLAHDIASSYRLAKAQDAVAYTANLRHVIPNLPKEDMATFPVPDRVTPVARPVKKPDDPDFTFTA